MNYPIYIYIYIITETAIVIIIPQNGEKIDPTEITKVKVISAEIY